MLFSRHGRCNVEQYETKIYVELGSKMKFMVIFFFLNCLHGQEADGNDEFVIPKLHRTIGKNYFTSRRIVLKPDTDQTMNPNEVQNKPTIRNLPEALELVRKKKTRKYKNKFDIRRDFIPMSETKNIEDVAYFCPPESQKENKRSLKDPKFLFCWYLKERSNAVLSSIDCTYEPQPLLWNYPAEEFTCGGDHLSRRYRFRHKVCWKEKSFLLKLPNVKDKRDKVLKMQRETIEVYSICLRKLEQVLYLKYNLIVASNDELFRVRDQIHELQTKTEGYVTLDLKNWPKLFETKGLQFFLENMFGNRLNDTLIPQMLISQTHMKPNIVKNALHNYLNIKPQWQSVENNWLRLEYHIWKLGLLYSRGIFIYAGTYDYDNVTNERKRKQLNFQIDEFTQQSIPFIWWKLIINKGNEGIILAIQNEPYLEGKPYSSEKLCEKSICKMHGWDEVDEFGYCCAFDEEKRKLLNLNAEKIKILRVFSLIMPRSRLIKWFKNLLKIK